MRIAKLAAVVVVVVGSVAAGTTSAADRLSAPPHLAKLMAQLPQQQQPATPPAVIAPLPLPAPVPKAEPAPSAPERPVAQESQKKAEPPPRRAARTAPPRRDPRVDTSECVWVGKRTIRVLMRDDLIAAEGFLKFYNTFGCPVRHLGQAFGCSLAGTDGAPVKDVESRIDVCWKDPAAKLEASTPAQEPQAQQPGAAKPPAQQPARPPMPKAAAPAAKPAPPPPAKPEPETSYPKR